MWLCLNDSFVSVVRDLYQPGNLLVRSRRREHLERLFGAAATIQVTEKRDYRFRVSVPRAALIDVLTSRIEGLNYPNFKDSVREASLHDLYTGFWYEHRKLQDNDLPPTVGDDTEQAAQPTRRSSPPTAG